MTGQFAEGTTVSVEKSRAELEKLIVRHGATQFASGWYGNSAMVGFVIGGRGVRFVLQLPDKSDKRYAMTPARRFMRKPEDRTKAWEQDCRSRWRALVLVIKAKLEAVQVGISTIEDEFLAWTVLPGGDGRTVGEQLRPQLAAAMESGQAPRLLLNGGA